MKRYTQLPMTLFWIQPCLPVRVRDRATQESLGRTSYTELNGFSVRPYGLRMAGILRDFPGTPRMYRFHGGMTLPDGLCVWRERRSHWSIHVTRDLPLDEFDERLTMLLESVPSQTVQEFWNEIESG
ncbi:hypothetical protein M427DRAFT_136145 [Gonapodya prolifera JEL478]|uniref:Tse2 ADP-ribosyltransferase toxin domain-containing protein n=1 Tax=Gonapodya prolifera (strain JEL478) TaxID=1344416 RepID=A0A139AAY9_GONPJ|nr:hypothetical protein M427DRAFT_136145 [Gonapodya prolifera JEL478]|eukprot:KXS13834.1 hypothetical protein M427DRAFT_136145 [Gonapodya prolifera JEL478]